MKGPRGARLPPLRREKSALEDAYRHLRLPVIYALAQEHADTHLAVAGETSAVAFVLGKRRPRRTGAVTEESDISACTGSQRDHAMYSP